MKIILIISGIIVALAIIVAFGFWYLSSQPFYKPGMVSKGEKLSAPLTPPTQPEGSETWLIEPGIELAPFAEGQGRAIVG